MDKDRRTLRVKVRGKIEFHNSKTFISANMLDISAGGVFIETDAPLPIDSPCALRLTLPGDTVVMDMQGRVVWTKQSSNSFPAGMGIHFTNMDPQHAVKIQAFIHAAHETVRGRPPG